MHLKYKTNHVIKYWNATGSTERTTIEIMALSFKKKILLLTLYLEEKDIQHKVIEYVVDKYGADQVAHIITFGSMAARSSVRDVARVLDLPLSDADRIAKLIPERPGTTLNDAFSEVKELREIRNSRELPEFRRVSFRSGPLQQEQKSVIRSQAVVDAAEIWRRTHGRTWGLN